MKPKHRLLILKILVLLPVQAFCQENSGRSLTMQDAFDLALKNSEQLRISQTSTAVAHQKLENTKLARLPEISSGLTYGYLSNLQIWNHSFDKHTTKQVPHTQTQFSVQASEVVFAGGEINNNLEKAALEEQVAILNHTKNIEDIKFLVAAKYLDIYRLVNQRQVYVDNIHLSEERLKNILSLKKQGLVTNNDVLRTKLIISDLKLALRKTDDNIHILNQQLNAVLGLDLDERLIPDPSLLTSTIKERNIQSLMAEANENNKELKTASKEIEIAETNLKIIDAERHLKMSLFAASNFQRPYIYSTPALDIFYNTWMAGVSIRYNISSIYQAPGKIKAGKIQVELAHEKKTLQEQNVEIMVNANLVKLNEAKYELTTYTEDLQSAEENFRIVEKKYFNQLALLADLIDANNTKIEAELKVSNARINVVYAQYQLEKSVGSL